VVNATINMRTVTRALIFIGATLIWLVVLTLLNASFLNTDKAYIVIGSVVAGFLSMFAVAATIRI
jgi:hypothetical protein